VSPDRGCRVRALIGRTRSWAGAWMRVWCCAARIMAEMPGKLPLRVCGLRTCPSACSRARHRADYPVSALESGVEWIEQGVVLRWAGLGSPSAADRFGAG
jgi:hypothetical protein